MSVANRMYLDMKYDDDTPIGLTWAGIVSVKTCLRLGSRRPSLPACRKRRSSASRRRCGRRRSPTFGMYEYLAFPRLAAIAEIGLVAAIAAQVG